MMCRARRLVALVSATGLVAACSSGGGATSTPASVTAPVSSTVGTSTAPVPASPAVPVANIPTTVTGATGIARVRGTARLDGNPLTAKFMGAVVRADGLVTACQAVLPAVTQGRFEISVFGDGQLAGCGHPGAEIVLWTDDGERRLFAESAIAWPTSGSADAEVTFSTANPAGAVPTTLTELYGEVHDPNGTSLPTGSRIEAYIGANLCGVASTRTGEFNGYIIAIVGPDSRPGCSFGATVTFRVNGHTAAETRVNDGQGQRDPFDLTVQATETATAAAGPITTVADRPLRPGAQRLHFEIGPIAIRPGQNSINFSQGAIPQPRFDGWIVRIAPNLHVADGTIPGVDVIHLHHGVWLNLSAKDATRPELPERIFAAGEEKTTAALPDGYGYRYRTTDKWLLNYMIHNLWPNDTQIWITYDIDIVPADRPEATGIVAARPIWTDVQNGQVYGVFDVIKGTGHNGQYTYPDDAAAPYGSGLALNTWIADRDGVLVAAAGHLHPGGLHTDLSLQRGNDNAHLFASDAHYWEPAGAVSWDVAMTATDPTWRVAVHQGDTLAVSATYDSGRASWYESMGIMVVWMADTVAPGEQPPPDPFQVRVDQPGQLTHGHLAENDNHGGNTDARYHDASNLPSVTAIANVPITDFVYGNGDMLRGDPVPTLRSGSALTFDNNDAPNANGEWHTITACKSPCNQSTGIAYPLADGDIAFDSGELGTGGPPTAERTTWTTPADLPAGTYTYFCRIHPFMRGAFRITP